MGIKNKKYYERCQGCIYYEEAELKKGNEVIATDLHCICKNVEEIQNDYIYCEYYEKYIGECEEQMEETKVIDNVNHPKHYDGYCSIECIDNMRLIFGNQRVTDYCIVNAYKYLSRYKYKNGYEDLRKAKWYLDEAEVLKLTMETDFDCELFDKLVDLCNRYMRDIENEE